MNKNIILLLALIFVASVQSEEQHYLYYVKTSKGNWYGKGFLTQKSGWNYKRYLSRKVKRTLV